MACSFSPTSTQFVSFSREASAGTSFTRNLAMFDMTIRKFAVFIQTNDQLGSCTYTLTVGGADFTVITIATLDTGLFTAETNTRVLEDVEEFKWRVDLFDALPFVIRGYHMEWSQ